MAEKERHCSFCGKKESEVRQLIASPEGTFICENCVEICKTMLDEALEKEDSANAVKPVQHIRRARKQANIFRIV